MRTAREKTLMAICIGGFAVCVLLAWTMRPENPAPAFRTQAAVPSSDPVRENARFEECRAKLKKAHELDLLYDFTMDPAPHVVVGPTFYTIPIDAKQGFADTVNCLVMAGKEGYMNFDLFDYRTGKVVAEYSYGQLTVK
jgi:hypothetical protein